MQRGLQSGLIAAGVWALLVPAASAVEGIYTCIDGKGRRLTSDRPIIECIDREQTQISPGGQVVRKIGPSLTAEERAVEEEKAKRAMEERNRQLEEKKRDRALLARYPDQPVHDKERAGALATIDEVIRTANERITDLRVERQKIDSELEFYQRDPDKAPARLKRQAEENEHQLAAQQRFIANQDEEKKRANARYDQELARLKQLWAQRATGGAAAAPSTATSSTAGK